MKSEPIELDSKKRLDEFVESFDDDKLENAINEQREDKLVSVPVVLDTIGAWWADQIHGSPIGRNAQAWGHLVKAMEDLRKRLEAL